MMLKGFFGAVAILLALVILAGAASARPFHIHRRDVDQWSTDWRPYMIRCPDCTRLYEMRGIDPYTREPIYCPRCCGRHSIDARFFGRPVEVVPDDQPSDYGD